MLRNSVLVFAGGFCGALVRYFLSAPLMLLAHLLLQVPQTTSILIPYDIFFINVSGALALGLLYGLVAENTTAITPEVRLLVGTGFLGTYTTLSTLAYGGEKLLATGQLTAGMLYLGGSLAVGLMATWSGYALAVPVLRLWAKMPALPLIPAGYMRRLYRERLTLAEWQRLRLLVTQPSLLNVDNSSADSDDSDDEPDEALVGEQ